MALNWDDSLLVGNAEIDDDHRQIFDYFEKLSTAFQDGSGEDVLKSLLKFLDEYVAEHFSHEETFMVENNYPKLSEQQSQHAYFLKAVKELQEMDMKGTDAHELSITVYRKLIQWFIQHIKKCDQELVNYVKSQQHY